MRGERWRWLKWRDQGRPLLSFSILLLSSPQWADLLLISRLDSSSREPSPRLRLKAGPQQTCTHTHKHTSALFSSSFETVYQTHYRVLKKSMDSYLPVSLQMSKWKKKCMKEFIWSVKLKEHCSQTASHGQWCER